MVKIASCSSHKYLFDKIVNAELNSCKVELTVKKFSDGEIYVQYEDSIRGRDLFLFGDTSHNLTELLLAIDAAKRSSCKVLTVILPYYGYGRQDKKDGHRGALGASVMAHVLEAAGANRIVSIDLHAEQIQGMFNIPLEHIKGHSIFIDYIRDNIDLSNAILCAPDGGAVHRVSKYSGKLDIPMVNINKTRKKANEVESMKLIGSVEGKDVIVIDDMLDTCGTLKKCVALLKEGRALKVYYVSAHPVLSGNAEKNLSECDLEQLIVSDTIQPRSDVRNPIIKVISCIPVLEQVMLNLINDESISKIND